MAEKSNVEWTNSTWPVVQGCDYESPGCSNCYAVPLIWRLAHNPLPKISDPLRGLVAKRNGKLFWTGKIALRNDRLSWPLDWREPRMIFLPSHGDLFHPEVPDWFIDRVFAVMALAPQHTFQLLTKRADRMRSYLTSSSQTFPGAERNDDIAAAAFEIRDEIGVKNGELAFSDEQCFVQPDRWPLPNVWLGVSAEDQLRWDQRTAALRDTPAAIRFVSAEPLLGLIHGGDALDWLDWCILGNESGNVARDGNIDHLRALLRQCQRNGVAAFVKQIGRFPIEPSTGRDEAFKIASRKGGDPDEWPEDLRVREFPKVAA